MNRRKSALLHRQRALKARRSWRVGFISLGCPKNQVDCELMISRALGRGFRLAETLDAADAAVINTCAFIESAQQEADEEIRNALALKDAGQLKAVVVAGCLPQYLKERAGAAYPGVDAWLTPDNPQQLGDVLADIRRGAGATREPDGALPEYLADAGSGRVLSTPPSLAYLKIAEGCNHRCRFCIIPELRGRYRSRPVRDLLAEARELVTGGLAELVLVSQDSSFYGRDLQDGTSLALLLRELAQLPGNCWIRVMYLYPSHITPELLDAFAATAPRVLPYFDIPLQHVSARVLKSMGRSGSRKEIDALLARIRSALPAAVIRTSLIAGYPGETEAEFAELLDWVGTGAVDRLGVFEYSDLPEMASHGLPGHVPPEVKQARQEALMLEQERVIHERQQELIGARLEVLLEEEQGRHEGHYYYLGRSWRDAYEIDGLVELSSAQQLALHTRVQATVSGADGYDLTATHP